MSTKTLRKRIALVAVSALGFGLLSSVPAANAAVTGKVSVLGQSVSRAGTSTTIALGAYVLSTSGTITAVANDAFTARVLTVPAGSALEVGDKFQSADGTYATAVQQQHQRQLQLDALMRSHLPVLLGQEQLPLLP